MPSTPLKLSVRLSLMVVFAITVLLSVSLLIMFHYSRKAVKEEALNTASQALEVTVLNIDNILMGVEQASGNLLSYVVMHLDEPDKMFHYTRMILEANENIIGCAIAFEPYYYKEKGQYFMAYSHRVDGDSLSTTSSPIIQADTYGNCPYPEQSWYAETIEKGRPLWTDPLEGSEADGGPITSFCLPIYDRQWRLVGVMGFDLSLTWLSQAVLASKPSPNSYCTLLGRDGTYIVHPDSSKLFRQNVFTSLREDTEPTVEEAARATVNGETGYKYFRLDGKDSYVFYKPFVRISRPFRYQDELGWSVGVIFPEEDIFGDYNRLLIYVVVIAFVGLLLLLVLCLMFTHRQLVPLRLLTAATQHIAEGHYDAPIPDSRHYDEIARLQANFQRMQQSLSVNMGQLQQLTEELDERGEVLRRSYDQAQEADRMKTAFLHHMTDQMMPPVNDISMDVDNLTGASPEETVRLTEDIQQKGKKVTELLNTLLQKSEER